MFKGSLKSVLVGVFASFGPVLAQAQVTEVWSAEGFMNPESVLLDENSGGLYVSNINGGPLDKDGNGFISKVTADGSIEALKWIEGLNAPKGMVMAGTTLFVSDIDQLIEIDTTTGEITNSYPADGSVFLNDPAVGPDGEVYVSDIAKPTIWQLKDGEMTVWYEDADFMHPNGLKVEGDTLIVAGWGREMQEDGTTKGPGNLMTIDLGSKTLQNLGSGAGIGNLDGLERDAIGNFLVTDFMDGALHRIKEDGSHEMLIDLNMGSADLEVIKDGTLAIIPMMMDGKVTAYSVQ